MANALETNEGWAYLYMLWIAEGGIIDTEVKNCMNACCNLLSEFGCLTTQCKCFNPW